ncbi:MULTISPECIES: ArnT family glycosyltransferase [Pseudomonas]|uniref:Putative 4-amino-4-deoxy-l-arabinose lipid A transferase n=1 Tax=Pseudomonas fluorescens (strain Pf0-1) TaxID=205922 RepID=Q3KCC8_PSEPF|nr:MULTISPECIES: glycosyltransferase family 39 protein [Pseudomonas]ABA74577.1 putative 4-amino- 4-deoxy-l-arabinose lipid A transferase [Pseudomonas fluorescens Pf0-1]MBL0796497.1 glycosyltransferase family 39 protein [Pseudomonas sp. B7]MBY9026407.1 glycosyltransferase family 39 protein [Pseudomonas fluorescens]MBY9030252.1 glycosyltransferase family 39 protein [Pseudomonas fluorescens]MBY9038225.1 glycosyltransferase family 39 protein [Pseudomonas fluorescens]
MTVRNNDRAALLLLLAASALMLLLGLGSRELWGAETRWANIALQMLQSGDYFDPYLKGDPYYDKPLLSYWMITATAWLTGSLDHWSLRLSSVVSAWLSVWLVYQLGEQRFRKGTGLIAGWMLATTFYFVFWARVATADILTVCGVLAAVWWYWRGPEDTRFSRYVVFCGLLALTSLFKGLIGFILPGLVLLPHLLHEGRWKRHLNLRLLAALVIAGAFYMTPFLLSHLYGAPNYGESGLGLVLRENVVRFFQPFDNIGPIYTYLLYLPIYTLPWAPCWIIALWVAACNWKHIEPDTRWLIQGLGLLMLFFTASGSRRSYYVLPLVPFAQLLGAWWITRRLAARNAEGPFGGRGLKIGFGVATVLLLGILGVLYPWTNSGGGAIRFGETVRLQASQRAPLSQWHVVMVEVDNKVPMYLQTGGAPFYYVPQSRDFPRDGDTAAMIAWLERTSGQQWDPQRTLFVAQYRTGDPVPLSHLSRDHQVITTTPTRGEQLFHGREDQSVAYLPQGS